MRRGFGLLRRVVLFFSKALLIFPPNRQRADQRVCKSCRFGGDLFREEAAMVAAFFQWQPVRGCGMLNGKHVSLLGKTSWH